MICAYKLASWRGVGPSCETFRRRRVIRFEMIFMILAGMLMATLMLNEHEGNMADSDTVLTSKIGLNAISIANSYIERVTSNSLYFDEYTRTHAAQPRPTSPMDSAGILSNLSTVLGRDGGETTMRTFNDVDDFNGYNDTVGVLGVGLFHVRCSVNYYDPATDAPTNTKTWFKIFNVVVTDTVLGTDVHYLQFQGQQAAIQKSVILSYFNFM
jgi:hypothetical protein